MGVPVPLIVDLAIWRMVIAAELLVEAGRAGGGIRTEVTRTGRSLRRRPARRGPGAWLSAIGGASVVAVLCLTGPAVAAALGWSTQPEPVSWAPGGISCAVGSACVMVGGRSGPTRNGLTAAALWNGRRWVQQHTPSPVGGGSLGRVSCSSRSACMAVGSGARPLAERWNGRQWSLLPAPYRHRGTLDAVSCSSLSACTAVGWANVNEPLQDVGMLVERWNGRSWAVQTAPSPGWALRTLFNSVSCVSSTLCTAVGMSVARPDPQPTRALIERWDGRRWTIDRAPLPDGSFDTGLTGVACASSAACTAVGDVDGAALVERWNGRRWSIQPTPYEVQAPLTGVSCVSATVCEAVGTANQDAGGSSAPPTEMVAERWNGRRWSLQQVPQPAPAGASSWFNAVACASARSCFALGADSGIGAGVFERYS